MKRQVLKFILGMYTPMFFYLTILVAFYMYYFANMVCTNYLEKVLNVTSCLEFGLDP